ncbi:MAG: hypothetical protein KGL39_09940 [Patescibacteria group bacterium]|nr:hypothetical protein [Patescibacteria group bacterium]
MEKLMLSSQFSEDDIRAIRQAEGKVSAGAVADYYQVGVETIRRIWRRDTFRHFEKEAKK